MPEVFRYKPLRGRLSPMVTIGVVGFDYRAGNRIYVQVGDGSFIPIYLHDIEVQVGADRFVTKIAFSDKLGVTFHLLGRMGIFDRFKVCFNDRQGVLTFEALASQ
ncbi:MAG: hypothetical protein CVU38_17155 [Chloroflexi bacterium HGW-Chloroflexi-1]|nr:MAG: hypothetical protein CVU38_17155 [Chloroflexi bacterium HGW-Chloroflexi-1]